MVRPIGKILLNWEEGLSVGADDADMGALVVGFEPSTDAWARGVVLDAWQRRFPGDTPTLGEVQTVQAIGRHEGSYGLATKPAAWVGSNNWGAVQCGHGAPCGASCFETTDTHADGTKYTWCYKKYPDAVTAAADLIRLVTEKRPTTWQAMRDGDADAVARTMGETHYHESKVEKYAAAVARNARELAEHLGETWVVRRAEDPPLEAPPQPEADPSNAYATAETEGGMSSALAPLALLGGGYFLAKRIGVF